MPSGVELYVASSVMRKSQSEFVENVRFVETTLLQLDEVEHAYRMALTYKMDLTYRQDGFQRPIDIDLEIVEIGKRVVCDNI